jgi:sRNA-binding protein
MSGHSPIGVHVTLMKALNLTKDATDHLMAWWTRRSDYLRAVAAPGSQRFNLDGTVAGEVSDQHRADTATALTAPKGKPKPKPIPQERGPLIMSATLQAKSIKATVLLDASDISRLRVLEGTSKVALRVNVGNRAITADLNARSVRRAVAAIQAAGEAGASVILQGRLEGDVLLEAGIVAQPKTSKATVAA